MTDTVALIKLIDESGLKKAYIAEKIGLSYQGLKNKLDGISDFTVTEMNLLCDVLHINSAKAKESIFFARKVD